MDPSILKQQNAAGSFWCESTRGPPNFQLWVGYPMELTCNPFSFFCL